jgi:DNA-directed RNA polymerase subunit RPC12/RpoP
MFFKTEWRKLLTAVLVVPGLYGLSLAVLWLYLHVRYLQGFVSADESYYSFHEGVDKTFGEWLKPWVHNLAWAALVVMVIWLLLVYLTYRRKDHCVECGVMTQYGVDGEYICPDCQDEAEEKARWEEAQERADAERKIFCPHCGRQMEKKLQDLGGPIIVYDVCVEDGTEVYSGEERSQLENAAHRGGYNAGLGERSSSQSMAAAQNASMMALGMSIGSSMNANNN